MIESSFKDYKISDEVLKAIDVLGYKSPTKVQAQVIPSLLTGRDTIVKSRTGSGKTAAFAIPICDLVEWEENKPQVLVVTPTRELAIQVKEDIFNVGRYKRIKVCVVFGKAPFHHQKNELMQKTHVVVGTPGRIIDHIEQKTIDLTKVKYLVIDEADEMLNMGFIEQMVAIIHKLSKDRVTVLLSATMPKDIKKLCDKYMNNPISIDIEEQTSISTKIIQEQYVTYEDEKIDLLTDITILENPDSCMIFCNTQLAVENVYEYLQNLNYSCEKIHGGMEQKDRIQIMNNFKLGNFRYLVATDVAARGLDIDNVTLVINYDVPKDSQSYVHRIGRTGRLDRSGKAITLVKKDDKRHINDIQKYIEMEILTRENPDKEALKYKKKAFDKKMNTKLIEKEIKGAQFGSEIMKLHVNAGKRTKMRAVDIVGSICNIEDLTVEDIGIINIGDISTYVEILNNKGTIVLKELQEKPIKGRLRKVSKVEKNNRKK